MAHLIQCNRCKKWFVTKRGLLQHKRHCDLNHANVRDDANHIVHDYVHVKVWIHYFIGDTEGNNKWLGHYSGNKSTVQRPYRDCSCNFENMSNTNPYCQYTTIEEMRQLITLKQLDLEDYLHQFKAVSRYPIINALTKKYMPLSDTYHGPYAMMPPELLHTSGSGLSIYAVVFRWNKVAWRYWQIARTCFFWHPATKWEGPSPRIDAKWKNQFLRRTERWISNESLCSLIGMSYRVPTSWHDPNNLSWEIAALLSRVVQWGVRRIVARGARYIKSIHIFLYSSINILAHQMCHICFYLLNQRNN